MHCTLAEFAGLGAEAGVAAVFGKRVTRDTTPHTDLEAERAYHAAGLKYGFQWSANGKAIYIQAFIDAATAVIRCAREAKAHGQL